jgi:hypothetical protein
MLSAIATLVMMLVMLLFPVLIPATVSSGARPPGICRRVDPHFGLIK